MHKKIKTCMYIYIYKYIHRNVHSLKYAYKQMEAKMADDVYEGIENALNLIVSTTGRCGNMKKVLKTTIFDTGSNLRKLIAKLIDTN